MTAQRSGSIIISGKWPAIQSDLKSRIQAEARRNYGAQDVDDSRDDYAPRVSFIGDQVIFSKDV